MTTAGDVWVVKGLLNGDLFSTQWTSWDSYDPEKSARTFFDNSGFLTHARLLHQIVTKTDFEEVAYNSNQDENESGMISMPSETDTSPNYT